MVFHSDAGLFFFVDLIVQLQYRNQTTPVGLDNSGDECKLDG